MDFDSAASKQLSLKGVSCPINYVRICLALETLESNETLQVEIDKGEPESMVIPGLKEKGYVVEVFQKKASSIILKITCSDE